MISFVHRYVSMFSIVSFIEYYIHIYHHPLLKDKKRDFLYEIQCFISYKVLSHSFERYIYNIQCCIEDISSLTNKTFMT